MRPNDYQVAGSHYKRQGAIQHWDIIAMLRANYFIGCASKYVSRFEKKNGAEDLEKSAHFLMKAIEVDAPRVSWFRMIWYKKQVDQWVHSVLTETSPQHRLLVEGILVNILWGKYANALAELRVLIPQYRHATEPTSRYTNQ
jgi:hypothetical protein